MESSAEQKAIRIRVTPFRGLSFLLWRILALHFAITYTLYYSFYVFSVCHTWLWVWEERWKIHSNWTLWVWQCKLDFVNWISCFSVFFNFLSCKRKIFQTFIFNSESSADNAVEFLFARWREECASLFYVFTENLVTSMLCISAPNSAIHVPKYFNDTT